jgi:hypothetical protein
MRRVVGIGVIALVAGPLLALGAAAPAGAVSTEAQFRTAWDTATSIVLDGDITLTCAGGGAASRSGQADVVLDGQGHTIAMEDGCAERVLDVDNESGASVTLRNVTVRGGRLGRGQFGAGIRMDNGGPDAGDLTVIDSYFTDNAACGDGGAIDTEGAENVLVTITGTTIAGNSAPDAEAGAIWAESAAVAITNSTITNNSGGADMSAIANDGGSLTLRYVDVVDNPFEPGATCPVAPLTRSVPTTSATTTTAGEASTTAGEAPVAPDAAAEPDTHADDGSTGARAAVDGQIETDTLESFGSVITGNDGSSNCNTSDAFTTSSGGYNAASDASCGLTDPTDRQDVSDPGLSPLGASGGPTLTRVPVAGSPLLDAIPAHSPCGGVNIVVDQRGLPRPTTAGSFCDIGAVEVQVTVVSVQPTFTG